jgi:hypothetical protein
MRPRCNRSCLILSILGTESGGLFHRQVPTLHRLLWKCFASVGVPTDKYERMFYYSPATSCKTSRELWHEWNSLGCCLSYHATNPSRGRLTTTNKDKNSSYSKNSSSVIIDSHPVHWRTLFLKSTQYNPSNSREKIKFPWNCEKCKPTIFTLSKSDIPVIRRPICRAITWQLGSTLSNNQCLSIGWSWFPSDNTDARTLFIRYISEGINFKLLDDCSSLAIVEHSTSESFV